MEQRRPRLGDVLDDYCPRERRITNHVIVAMIEDKVKQTRCTTCNGDHDYKQARTPSPRRPKAVAAIQGAAESFEQKPSLASPARLEADSPDLPDSTTVELGDAREAVTAAAEMPSEPVQPLPQFVEPAAQPAVLAASANPVSADDMTADATPEGERVREDDGPVHRRLIRAALPRPEGYVPERKEPEFTIRQPGGRGREADGNRTGGHRPGGQRPQGGFGQGGGQSRFGGQRHGSGPHQQRQGGRPGPNGPNGGQRDGRPDGPGDSRGPRQGSGPGRRRGR
jgi:translation initiation factor IF-2